MTAAEMPGKNRHILIPAKLFNNLNYLFIEFIYRSIYKIISYCIGELMDTSPRDDRESSGIN